MKPIPPDHLDRAIRRAQRLCGALMLRVMAETDTSFEQIATRLGVGNGHVREWLMRLADGTIDTDDPGTSLRVIGSVLAAMHCELQLSAVPMVEQGEAQSR